MYRELSSLLFGGPRESCGVAGLRLTGCYFGLGDTYASGGLWKLLLTFTYFGSTRVLFKYWSKLQSTFQGRPT
jgi:hypothetical protein